MFNSFFDDSNKDGLLQKEDIDALIERLRIYRGMYVTKREWGWDLYISSFFDLFT